MPKYTLFHGSEQIIQNPLYGFGSIHNDYGQGFYCSVDYDLAGEWACKNGADGFINKYAIDTKSLKVLNLSDGNHTVLEWITILLKNRIFRLSSEISRSARDYLLANFDVPLSGYDIVSGYRADDSYFQYASAFIENTLSLQGLSKAMTLGKLGTQTALLSPKAFDAISFEGFDFAAADDYYPAYCSRDESARQAYVKSIKNNATYAKDLFIIDILREEIKRDDARIQRIIPK